MIGSSPTAFPILMWVSRSTSNQLRIANATVLSFFDRGLLYSLECYPDDVSVKRHMVGKAEAQAKEYPERDPWLPRWALHRPNGSPPRRSRRSPTKKPAWPSRRCTPCSGRETRELLRHLIERTIRTGDDEPVPVTAAARGACGRAEPDARRRAELEAALTRSITERVAPIVRIAGEAAATDPELAAMMEVVKAARREGDGRVSKNCGRPRRARTSEKEAAATSTCSTALRSPHAHG